MSNLRPEVGTTEPPNNVLPFINPRTGGGTPVRKPITRSRKTIRVRYPSIKANRVIECESALEATAAHYIDLSKPVSKFACQPFKIDLLVNGETVKYTPDFRVDMTNGQTLIVEVKPLTRCIEEETRMKLAAAHHHFSELGYEYVILTDEDIGDPEKLENLRTLRYYARVPVDHVVRVRARTLVGNAGFISFEALEKMGFTKPTIYSLLANQVLSTDLSNSINPYSPISLPKESDHETCLFKGRSALDLR